MNDPKLTEPRFLLTIFLLLVAVAYDFAITFWKPVADPNLIGMVFGILNGTGYTATVNFWLGSSKSSADKDQTISETIARTTKP